MVVTLAKPLCGRLYAHPAFFFCLGQALHLFAIEDMCNAYSIAYYN